jgi:glycine cleavage system H lipoate-binding protein/ABC-type phosphate transport system substrate-binding protein
MKAKQLKLIGFFLLVYILAISKPVSGNFNEAVDTLKISCSSEMYTVVSEWAKDFSENNSGVHLQVSNIDREKINSQMDDVNQLLFVKDNDEILNRTDLLWQILVTREIIVPVMNSSNPYKDVICSQGISLERFKQTLNNQELQSWGNLLSNQQETPVQICVSTNPTVQDAIKEILEPTNVKRENLIEKSEDEVLLFLNQNPNAIGFCKLSTLLDENMQTLLAGVSVIPIDKNSNGKIDFIENIYKDANDLRRGAWIGKYPKPFIQKGYSVAGSNFNSKTGVEFLNWVVYNGQQLAEQEGFSPLLYSEQRKSLAKLMINEPIEKIDQQIAQHEPFAITRTDIIILAVLIIGIALLVRTVWAQNRKVAVTIEPESGNNEVFDIDSLKVPKGLLYDKSHTWMHMKEDGAVRIGIDDFLQHITGPITRIKMLHVGDSIKKGEPFLSIVQNGKQLTIYSPISGKIQEQNIALDKNSSIINKSPYQTGWIYLIEPTNWVNEIRFYFMEKKYKEWITSEFQRLKDFMSYTIKPNDLPYAFSTLQDGGEIKTGVLEDFGPKVWEEFQVGFIDKPQ